MHHETAAGTTPAMGTAPVLDVLEEACRALWRCQDGRAMLGALAAVLRARFGVTHASAPVVVGSAKAWRWEEAAPLDGMPPLDADATSRLAEAFRAAPEAGEGKLFRRGDEFAFLLGESGGERRLFLGRARPAAAGTQGEASWRPLGFVASQAQEIFRWMSRHERTRALVHRDDLTGLYNYRFLDTSLDAEIRRVQRFQTSFCLLFIDLDNFKPVNDDHGHLSGSGVLRQVADVLRDALREVDTVFRYGGDEYVVLLLEANGVTGAMAAERIRSRIEAYPFRVDGGRTVRLTCSIGVAACPEHGTDKESLLAMADASMYKSKKSGKNRVTVAPETAAANREPAVGAGAPR